MARWEPDPQGRLLHAALDLFEEEGYDATTTARLAERAGLTKATVFRLFSDKREILFQGQGASVRTVGEVTAQAPSEHGPLEVVRSVVSALADEHRPEQRTIGRRIDRILGSSVELRERAAFKRWSIAAALEQGLVARGVSDAVAGPLADLGIRAYYDGFAEWTLAAEDTVLRRLVLDRLDVLLAGLRVVLALDGSAVALPV